MGKWITLAAIYVAVGGLRTSTAEVVVGDNSEPALIAPSEIHPSARAISRHVDPPENEEAPTFFVQPRLPASSSDEIAVEVVEAPEDDVQLLERPGSQTPLLPAVPRLIESTWYTRFEYMNWSHGGYLTDSGPLYTLGYRRRVGHERYRAEFFGGQVHDDLDIIYADQEKSKGPAVNYLGGRVEYDLLFEPIRTPRLIFFAGVGSRFWFRQQAPRMLGDYFVEPMQRQTWATFYPYIGIESRRNPQRRIEFFGRGRVGLLAVTFESYDSQSGAFRNPGVTGQVELGWRGEKLFLSGYFEAFAWPRTPDGYGFQSPSALLLTVGLQTGYTF